MATPVGPTPADPNDPDLWDWDDPSDAEEPMARRRPLMAILALGLVVVLVVVIVATSL